MKGLLISDLLQIQIPGKYFQLHFEDRFPKKDALAYYIYQKFSYLMIWSLPFE